MAPVDRVSPEGGFRSNSRAGGAPPALVFVCDGEHWTLGRAGARFSLRDTKGLSYLQRLLQHPGEEFHVLDLVNGPGNPTAEATGGGDMALLRDRPDVSVRGLGDAGEMLDAQAKLEYKRRLAELGEELEDLRARGGGEERAAEVESEIDFIKREVLRAVGLGGRSRRAGSMAERARLNVTRAIKSTIEKVAEHDSAIGQMLARSIRTGLFCSYVPDSLNPTIWRFSLSSEPESLEESSAPTLAPSESPFAQALAGRTVFVGREMESAALDAILKRARDGSGRVVMISGPAGVGKTRMAAEFCAKASREGLFAIAGSCNDREVPVPFLPFVEIIESALNASSPKAFRDVLGDEAAEVARLMPQLRRRFPDIPPPLEVAPEQSRQILLTSIAKVIERAARASPVILLLDDLHWADEGTLSVLSHLAKSLSRTAIVVVGTYRDHDLDPSGPLAQSLDHLTRLHLLDRISLPGLSRDAVAAMIRDLCIRDPSPAVVSFIYSNTEGNPFFVEELFHHLVEHGHFLESTGEFRSDFPPSAADVPNSLRLMVWRHLSGLGDDTLKSLGTAAAIGRSFTFELLEAATGADAESLLDRIEEAEKAGLIRSTLEFREARFRFSHELVRQVVLGGLSVPRRQRIHLGVANAIERLYPDAVGDYANDLAYHMLQAGTAAHDPSRTVRYLAMAANREISQSAYDSALHHLKNALELVPKLPKGQERDRTELDLLVDYGVTLVVLRGWYVPEMGEVYARARVLCNELGETQRLLSVLFGLCSFHLCRAELKLARACVEEMSSLALDSPDDKMVQIGWLLGNAQFFMGEFANAHASFEIGVNAYQSRNDRSLVFRVGQDLCVSCLGYDAMTLLILGFPDQAEKLLQESLSLARKLGYPFTLTLSLITAANYYCIRREFHRLPEIVSETTALAKEHGFALYEEAITAFEIIGLAAEGKVEELKARIRGAKRFSEVRYELASTWARSTLAEGLAHLGRVKSAFPLLAEASEMMNRNDERYVESEIRRILGVLTMKQTEGRECTVLEVQSAHAEAETLFREAKEIARRQGARLFELRAAKCLSELLMDLGRTDEARRILGETYELFTEGLDAPDLRLARNLLDTLRRVQVKRGTPSVPD